MQLTDLETPALVIDRPRLMRNIDRMRRRLAKLGVPLRPHVKTAKSVDVVRMAVEGQPGGITVSTLREADYFAEHGFTDILYAVGIVPSKLPHVASLRSRGVDVAIILDSVEMAEAVVGRAEALRTVFPVLIEVDTDGGRAGVAADDHRRLVEIGRILNDAPGTELRGVMTHAGLSYNQGSPEGIRAHAEQERSR